ncbi:MAG: YggT family protein [Gammaproteobacteria bacterium]|nr:YggT family protein [Gammaproteobacteria bacterium]MDH5802123.1 YggT family protein [Gammaproteobacteria bacterium]
MGAYAGNAGIFLIETIFGLYLVVVMLRFLFQFIRADFRNPVSQFIFKVTNPPLVPMRRFIPGFMGLDMSSLVLMLLLQALEIFLVKMVQSAPLPMTNLLMLTVAELLQLLIYVYLFSILVQVILSWVNPGGYNPVAAILYALNEPLLGRARRLMPPISGFDLSPIVVLIILQLLNMTIVAYLKNTFDTARVIFVGG